MSQIRLSDALKAAVLAGLVGGLLLGIFHLLLTEPFIEKAIALEQSGAGAGAGEEVVSRGVQKVGLVAGALILGALLGAIFAGPYAFFHRWLPGAGARQKGVFLALLAYWSIALFPFLKYPANPPGVGEPGTIVFRQAAALGFLALSVIGIGLAIAVYRILERRDRGKRSTDRIVTVAGGYTLYAVALYLLMPANPDEIRMPAEIMTPFRWLSIAGLSLLWAAIGAAFSLFWKRFSNSKAVARNGFAHT